MASLIQFILDISIPDVILIASVIGCVIAVIIMTVRPSKSKHETPHPDHQHP